ncbi:L,D-transpeptidase [Acidimangrovimonas pyrenivorans]|uniref:L,D-transpeptidase n=1 Tax=Acidimangrovimonas pyrenivorans TaxID=2030798 RepID=A0ABV7AJM7_9RHOB
MDDDKVKRRGVLGLIASGVAALALPLRGRATTWGPGDWPAHFATLSAGAILIDSRGGRLHFWAADGVGYHEFPCRLPQAADLRRRGRTEVVRKLVGPTWRPTPAMFAADPALPRRVSAGPDNPFGSHALCLGWRGYRIHGAPEEPGAALHGGLGCYGLSNAEVAALFREVGIGTPVQVI